MLNTITYHRVAYTTNSDARCTTDQTGYQQFKREKYTCILYSSTEHKETLTHKLKNMGVNFHPKKRYWICSQRDTRQSESTQYPTKFDRTRRDLNTQTRAPQANVITSTPNTRITVY